MFPSHDPNGFYFRLEDLSDPNSKDNLYNGYNSLHNNFQEGDRQTLLNIWMPTEFANKEDHHGLNAIDYNKNVSEVYGVCPHTTKWLNKVDPDTNYKYIFYPLNLKDIPPKRRKRFDVCYFGGLHSLYHCQALGLMQQYNYRYMTMRHNINELTIKAILQGAATDMDLPHDLKLERLAECKVSLCFNVVPVNEDAVAAIKSYPEWESNEAFSRLDLEVIPQFKSRMHEAALARTINLVYRDPWGISEDYYTPDKDFIYFDDLNDAKQKLDHILNNWEDYQDMVESAYNKAVTYSTESMFQIIKDNKEWKPQHVELVGQKT